MSKLLLLQAFFVLSLCSNVLFAAPQCVEFFSYDFREFVKPTKLLTLSPKQIEHVLLTQYAQIKILPSAFNKDFIKNAHSKDTEIFRFDGSFVYLKELNDGLGNKNLVTALVNFHKLALLKNLFKNEPLEYPLMGLKGDFSKYATYIYSDFKSIKISYKNKAHLPQVLLREVTKANLLLAELIRNLNLDLSSLKRDNLKSPEYWFKAGIGETTDKAGAASSWGRKVSHEQSSTITEFSNIRNQLKTLALEANNIEKTEFINLAKKYPKLFKTEFSSLLLKRELFEVLLKTKPTSRTYGESMYLTLIAKRLKNRFGYKLSLKEIQSLKRYKDIITYFVPELLVEKRAIIDVSKDTDYTFVDFVGQNPDNYYYTQIAVKETSKKSIDQIIVSARQTEQLATYKLNLKKEMLENVTYSVYREKNITQFTGDDGTTAAGNKKALYVSRVAALLNPAGHRVTWTSKNTKPEDRIDLSVQGELIHKELLISLERIIDYEILQKTVFGFDMSKADGPNKIINIYISGDINYTHKKEIRSALKDILKNSGFYVSHLYIIDKSVENNFSTRN